MPDRRLTTILCRHHLKATVFSALAALIVSTLPSAGEDLNPVVINQRIAAGFGDGVNGRENTIVVSRDGVSEPLTEANSPALSVTRLEMVDRPDLSLLVGSRHSTGVDGLVDKTPIYSQAEIVAAIQTESAKVGIDPKFALLIAQIESKYDQFALSEGGAIGIMQLMPGTAKDLGVENPWDALQNIRGGVSYLAQLFAEFSDPLIVAAAYHSGPESVRQQQGIPDGPRTALYVVRVLNEYVQIYKKAAPAAVVDSVNVASVTRREKPKRLEDEVWESDMVLHLD
jgi:Transglycosylase SLT domain